MQEDDALDVAETSTPPEDAQSSTPTTEDATEESSTSDAAPDDAPKSRAQERIEQLVAEKKALQEAAEFWRNQKTQVEPEAPKDDPRPTRAQFEYDDDRYDAALADWTERQIERRSDEAVRKSLETQRTQAQRDALQDKWLDASENFRKDHPDFDSVVYNPTLPLTESMFAVIQQSDKAADIAYHLGKHPDIAARIARKDQTQQAVDIGRLEAELSRPAPKPQPSRAPAPPNPVSGNASPSVDPSQMSTDEWMKWRSQELRNRRS